MSRGNGKRGDRQGKKEGKEKKKGKGNSLKNLRGDCKELEHHVFIAGDVRQADKGQKTIDAIVNYVEREFDRGQDIAWALEMGEHFNFDNVRPKESQFYTQEVITAKREHEASPAEKPAPAIDEVTKQLLTNAVKNYSIRMTTYEHNKTKLFALLWGQCQLLVRNKLESRKDWMTLKAGKDPLDLLKAIKEMIFNYDDGQFVPMSMHRMLTSLFAFKQQDKEGNTAYAKRFRTAVALLEQNFGKVVPMSYLKADTTYTAAPVATKTMREDAEHEKVMAMIFINGCSHPKAKVFLDDAANDYLSGIDKYPKTVEDAIEMMAKWKSLTPGKPDGRSPKKDKGGKQGEDEKNEQSHAQQGSKGNSNNNNNKRGCYLCGGDHVHSKCPHKERFMSSIQNQSHAQQEQYTPPTTSQLNCHIYAVLANNAERGMYDHDDLRNKLMLDNQSTCHIFCRENVLQNVRPLCPENEIILHTNGGALHVTYK